MVGEGVEGPAGEVPDLGPERTSGAAQGLERRHPVPETAA